MEFLKTLAYEVGGDGGQPTGGDVARVVQQLNLTADATTEALIRSTLVEAGWYLVASEAMKDDPLWAVNKYTDDRPSIAAAEHWQQEYAKTAEQELQGLLGKLRAG